LRQRSRRRRADPAREQPQQAVGQVVDIVQTVAQARIGQAQHPRARVVAHALHRGLGGEPGEQRLVETPPPTMIVRKHAECFQHLAMLAGAVSPRSSMPSISRSALR
jgi:hypothetical protein